MGVVMGALTPSGEPAWTARVAIFIRAVYRRPEARSRDQMRGDDGWRRRDSSPPGREKEKAPGLHVRGRGKIEANRPDWRGGPFARHYDRFSGGVSTIRAKQPRLDFPAELHPPTSPAHCRSEIRDCSPARPRAGL